MNRPGSTFATILMAGVAAFAQGTTDQILHVARNTWPGGRTVGIVCNYAKSGESVRAMLGAFEPGSAVKVFDVRHWDHLGKACGILDRVRPQYVLLLPDDPVVRDGSVEASRLIRHLNFRQIPTLATTPAALTQGAWAAMGPATGNVLLVNSALQGYIEAYGTPFKPATAARNEGASSGATLTVIAAF